METEQRLTDWQRPRQLARAIGVTRLTIYRWIAAGRVQVHRVAPRVIRVRLKPRDTGATTEPHALRAARAKRQTTLRRKAASRVRRQPLGVTKRSAAPADLGLPVRARRTSVP